MKKELLFLGIIFCTLLQAQPGNKSKGLKLLQEKKYSEAETVLTEAVKEAPADGQAYLFLGYALVNQDKCNAAIPNFKKAIELASTAGQTTDPRFQLARCAMLNNDKETALKYLDEAAKAGAGSSFVNRIASEKVFDPIRSDALLAGITEQMKKNSFPCFSDPNFKKFDFWVGVWDVYVSSGPDSKEYKFKVAVDSVVKSLGGCSLTEYFVMTPPSNFEGMSFTFYDADANRVRHNWAGSGGDIYNYEVIKAETNMVQLLATTSSGKLVNILTNGKGGTLQRRFTITYKPGENAIHQFIENSVDGGKTWKPDWDALFKKKS